MLNWNQAKKKKAPSMLDGNWAFLLSWCTLDFCGLWASWRNGGVPPARDNIPPGLALYLAALCYPHQSYVLQGIAFVGNSAMLGVLSIRLWKYCSYSTFSTMPALWRALKGQDIWGCAELWRHLWSVQKLSLLRSFIGAHWVCFLIPG